MMTVGSLFTGIGGFDLGFERAGFRVRWQVEIDPYCRKVLERHFPHAQRFADVRECGAHNLPRVDVVCGGFPCQDISKAGLGLGLTGGERSILWFEMLRIIRELRPQFVVVENSAELLARGMGDVLGSLAEIRYDAEWECIPAASFGAPHIRDRVWILAYPGPEHGSDARGLNAQSRCGYLFPERKEWTQAKRGADWELVALVPGVHPRSAADWWARQSRMDRSVNGLSRGLVDAANGALGNAVVPQIPELIARRILEFAA